MSINYHEQADDRLAGLCMEDDQVRAVVAERDALRR